MLESRIIKTFVGYSNPATITQFIVQKVYLFVCEQYKKSAIAKFKSVNYTHRIIKSMLLLFSLFLAVTNKSNIVRYHTPLK